MNRLSQIACFLLFLTCVALLPGSIAADETFLKPLEGWRVAIDPGPGRETVKAPFKEKAAGPHGVSEAGINQKVALFLSQFLENAGAEVTHTWQAGETAPSISQRLAKAGEFEANLIISIHHGYDKDPKKNYAIAYSYPKEKEPAASVAGHMATSLSRELKISTKGADAFAFPILAQSKIPAVMVSCGNISNPDFEKKLEDLEFNRLEAIALLKGMMNYQSELSRSGPSKPPMTVTETRTKTYVTPPIVTNPEVPFSKPPMPLPKPVTQPVTQPISPSQPYVAEAVKPFQPPMLNPVGSSIDQSWLYGETWGELPVRKGISFTAPAGTPVRAAFDGSVYQAVESGCRVAPGYTNCVIIRHFNVVPEVPRMFTVYGNLADMKVKKGDNVKRGDIIGTTGAPSTEANQNRDTEIVFEVRWGNLNDLCLVNPELFVEHATKNTGIIVGRLLDAKGNPMKNVRIEGASKPPEIERYSYSLTYGEGIPTSELYRENFVIGDVTPGLHILTSDYGIKRVRVEAGKITDVTWQVK